MTFTSGLIDKNMSIRQETADVKAAIQSNFDFFVSTSYVHRKKLIRVLNE